MKIVYGTASGITGKEHVRESREIIDRSKHNDYKIMIMIMVDQNKDIDLNKHTHKDKDNDEGGKEKVMVM